MKHLLYLLFTLILLSSSYSQNYKQIKVYPGSNDDIRRIASLGVDLEHSELTKDNGLVFFVDDEEFKNFSYLGISYEIIIDDWFAYYESLPKLTNSERKEFKENSKFLYNIDGFDFGSMGGYYTYNEVIAELDSMFYNFPNIITQKFSIGTSIEGRTIWAVKISDNPDVFENEPAAGFDALIHAREPQSMATLMYFMYYLLENYGTDPEVTYLVNNREIYCVPVYNPDGYERNRQTNPGGGGLWRKNRKNNGDGSYGVDLNRNYGYKWGYDNSGSSPTPSSETYRGPAPFSEPETQAVRNFNTGKDIMTYLNMHSYQNAFLYPWGYIDAHTPDSDIFIEFASDMSSYNNFSHGLGSQVLGYNSNGSARDWLYGEQVTKNKIFGYTMEIGSSSDNFWPPQSRIFPLAQINLKALLYNAWVAGDYVAFSNAIYNQQYFLPGNDVEMNIVLKNKGLSTAFNITAELTTLSSYATVINGTVSVDSIEARSALNSPDPFILNISSLTPIEEEIKFKVTVYTDGIIMSEDTVKIVIGIPEFVFIDSTNIITDLWTITSNPANPKWSTTTTSFYSSPNSYTDSPTGNYVNNATVTMTLTNPIDLSQYNNPKLKFWTKYDIESNWDYGQVKISTNNGTTWIPLHGNYTEPGTGSFQPNGQPVYDGVQNSWVYEEISLSGFTSSQVKLRFELRTDGAVVRDGWYLDDVGIIVYSAVPVELNSFTANIINGGVGLNWATASEINNSGFEIQRIYNRSHDLQTINPLWEVIGFVEGKGTTTEMQTYSFIDKDLLSGKIQYRLKQIDYDGTYSIYGPVEVENNNHLEFSLGQNYPNPFNPVTKIKFSIPAANPDFLFTSLKVYDILGKEVAVLINEVKEPGVYEVEFNLKGLSNGTYFYTLKAGNFTSTKKLMLIK